MLPKGPSLGDAGTPSGMAVCLVFPPFLGPGPLQGQGTLWPASNPQRSGQGNRAFASSWGKSPISILPLPCPLCLGGGELGRPRQLGPASW